MSLSDRDRKIAILLIPVVLVVAYWFLLLSPKHKEAADLGAQLTQAQTRKNAAESRLSELEGAKNTYASDYETVVRLGKAIPSSLDMPSLLVQLNSAAKGTHIRFNRVKAGARTEAPPPPAPATGSSGSDKSAATPAAAAGGATAQTGGGQAAESANNASKTSDSANQAAGADAATTGSAGAATGTSGVAGLESIPLEFTFSGDFSGLADFFHAMKRFVRVANNRISVKGRLMTIDGLTFEASKFPTLKAEVQATVYLSPKAEGAAAGATANGPQPTPASATTTAPTTSTSNTTQPAPSAVPTGGAEGSR